MIRNFIKFMQEEPNNKMYLRLLFCIFTFLFVVFALLRAFNALGFYFDTHEHIHSSYLISQGLVPYRDFFEHHHPLLWYLLCPLVFGFGRDAAVIYAGRLVGIFGYICFLALFYNTIKKYTKNNSTAAQIAVLVLFCFYHIWIDIQTLRPDIFMYVFIFAALSSFFNYLQTHKAKYLCYSYLSWFISFLFLQKALIAGFGFALANIWLLSKKEIKLKDVYTAAFFPLLGGCILLLVLYKIGALHEWWLYNFTFNGFLVSYYNIYSAGVGNLPFIAGILGIIIIRYFRPTDENITIFLCWLSTA
ncbi:MAG: glycosyltransferase family 39 protein, partial [Alphaproteobacteria bacterium]|nr:glycosyltransferase family 39 protein [Alphaproteobacteria bacterium]